VFCVLVLLSLLPVLIGASLRWASHLGRWLDLQLFTPSNHDLVRILVDQTWFRSNVLFWTFI
jgi:hypothetical protein